MKVYCPDNGIMHLVISDGTVSSHGLYIIRKNRAWLERKLSQLGVSIKDVFCMTVDDSGKIFIQKRDGKQIVR